MAGSTVPVTVVPGTIIQEPICLARRNIRRSRGGRSLKISSRLEFLTSSQGGFPSILSYLDAWRWWLVENSLSPVTTLINSILSHCKLWYFSSADVTVFCRPMPDFFAGIQLKVSMMGEIYFYFLNNRQDKSFPKEASPLLLIHVLCFLSRVAKSSTPTGLHRPPQRNFPGYISP